MTIWKAAEMAGLSLYEMIELVKEKRALVGVRAEDALRDIAAARERA